MKRTGSLTIAFLYLSAILFYGSNGHVKPQISARLIVSANAAVPLDSTRKGFLSASQPNAVSQLHQPLGSQATSRKLASDTTVRVQEPLLLCSDVLEQLRLQPVWNSPTVRAFRLIQRALMDHASTDRASTDANPETILFRRDELDKVINKALLLVASHFRSTGPSLSWHHFSQLLGKCFVDRTKKTYLMYFVATGLVDTLQNPITFRLTGGKNLSDLRDAGGNSLLHLATHSRNLAVLNRVISCLQMEKPDAFLKLAGLQNAENKSPRNLAIEMEQKDLTASLQAHYTIYSVVKLFPPDHIPVFTADVAAPQTVPTETSVVPVAEATHPCSAAFESLKRVPGMWYSPTVTGFRAMSSAVIGELRQFPQWDVDKITLKALAVINMHFSRSTAAFSVNQLVSLFGGCTLNQEHHTFYMRFVLLGLTETLAVPFAFYLKGRLPLAMARDAHGNTILHLAVMSGNVDVVNHILGILQPRADGPSMLDILNARNAADATAKSIAFSASRTDIITTLQAHHSIYTALKATGEHRIPGDTETGTNTSDGSRLPPSLTSCVTVYKQLKNKPQDWLSPTVVAFRVLGFVLTSREGTSLLPDADLDKLAWRSLFVIAGHFKRAKGVALEWRQIFQHFSGCVVDEKSQHTFLMRLITMGLTSALHHPLAYSFTGLKKLSELRDKEENNLIHLAVRSRNVEVVNDVIEAVQTREGDVVVKMLEAKNQDQQTPRDVAISLYRSDIVSALQARYMTYKATPISSHVFG